MNVLLHSCCAPCTNQCAKALLGEGHAVTLLWNNPNIHPKLEYLARRDALRTYASAVGLALLEEGAYGLRPFLSAVEADIDGRCPVCYALRMDAAAAQAAENGFDGFTTSLLISPYQGHETIVHAAQTAASRHGVQFVYRDFRPLFREGQRVAREMGLYMQKYCGCIFSEEERYAKKK